MQLGDGMRFEWRRFDEFSTDALYAVLQFRQAIFVVEQRCAYPDLDGRDRNAEHLLLWVDGALAGYLRLIPEADAARVAIGRVSVGSRWRRQGLARHLMTEALSRCHSRYPDHAVTLAAQTYLIPFYQGFGFRPTSPPYDDYGVPHIDMRL